MLSPLILPIDLTGHLAVGGKSVRYNVGMGRIGYSIGRTLPGKFYVTMGDLTDTG